MGIEGVRNTDRVLCEARSTVERVETLAHFLCGNWTRRSRITWRDFLLYHSAAYFVKRKFAQRFIVAIPEILCNLPIVINGVM